MASHAPAPLVGTSTPANPGLTSELPGVTAERSGPGLPEHCSVETGQHLRLIAGFPAISSSASSLARWTWRPPLRVSKARQKTMIGLPPRRCPHFRRVQAAVYSYIDAEVGCIGDGVAAKRIKLSMRLVGMVIRADGESTVRSGFWGGARGCGRGGMPCSRQLRLVGYRQPGRSQIWRFLKPPRGCLR